MTGQKPPFQQVVDVLRTVYPGDAATVLLELFNERGIEEQYMMAKIATMKNLAMKQVYEQQMLLAELHVALGVAMTSEVLRKTAMKDLGLTEEETSRICEDAKKRIADMTADSLDIWLLRHVAAGSAQ